MEIVSYDVEIVSFSFTLRKYQRTSEQTHIEVYETCYILKSVNIFDHKFCYSTRVPNLAAGQAMYSLRVLGGSHSKLSLTSFT